MKKKNNFKILIVCRCNNQIGTGHLKRSLQLQLNLIKEKFNCEIWTNKNTEILDIIGKIDNKSKIKIYKKVPLNINHFKNYRLVIFDLAWNDPWLDSNKNFLSKLIKQLDDLNIRVINIGKPKLDIPFFRSFIDIYPDGSKVKVSGNVSPRFITLRKEFSTISIKKKKSSNGSIFLSMGGTDPLNLLKKTLEKISEIRSIKHLVILIGNRSDLDKEFLKKLFYKSNTKFTILKNVDAKKIVYFMKKCDFTISAFGTTAFESMALGVPVLALTHYLHQDNSAKWFADLKTIEYLGCAEKGIKWKNLKTKLSYMYKNYKTFQNMGLRASSFVDGKGIIRITNHIKEIYKETFFNLDHLFIFAHPGTEALTTSGIISKLADSGKNIGIVVMGDGVSSRENILKISNPKSEMHIKLEKAFEESCNALGVKVKYFFRYKDNQFDSEPLLSFVKNIENIFKRHKPNCVWTHLDKGINIDHKVINEAVMVAGRPIKNSNISSVFGFNSPGSIDWSFSNIKLLGDNYYEEIDLKSQRRIKSFQAYSKIKYFNHSLHTLDHINLKSKINGKKIGVTAAESFYLIRSLNKI